MGLGFPLIDEGQVGFFYLPNLLFNLLPFWQSFNLGLVFSFCLASIGTYLFARSLNLSKQTSILAGLTYAFSPIMILRLHHYNLIQSAAIFPIMLWSLNSFFSSKKILYLGVFSFLLSQQIFAGFQQVTTYSLIGSTLFFAYKVRITYKKGKARLKVFTLFILAIVLSALVSAVQLNSTLTLLKESSRIQTQTPQKILNDFPFNPSNLKTLLDPFILGSANDATYPRWTPGYWGIFWENNAYFGISQLLLILVLTLAILRNKKILFRKNLLFFYLIGILGVLLALGKYGPLHPLFSIPPVSFFRVPSRFLIFTFLAASIISASGLEYLKQKTRKRNIKITLVSALIFLAITDVFRVWYHYPLAVKISELNKEPDLLEGLSTNSRIATFGQTNEWNKIFLEKGWVGQEKNYLSFKNLADQNLNIIYGYNNTFSYAAMSPRRSAYLESLIKQSVEENDSTLTLPKFSGNLFRISNTGHIIATKKINSPGWNLTKQVEQERTFYLYTNENQVPKVSLVNSYKVARTPNEIIGILISDDFDPQKEVILEEPLKIELSKNESSDNIVNIEEYKSNKITIKVLTAVDSILVIADSYYPGWNASINNEKTKIYPANINSRAIFVPRGNHTITFNYVPKRLYASILISITSFICLLFIIVKYGKNKIE